MFVVTLGTLGLAAPTAAAASTAADTVNRCIIIKISE